jgi:hypothetical protein
MPGADVIKSITNDDSITRNTLLQAQTKLPNYVGPDGKLMIEPTLIEDQKKRYLDHLHHLRRINEGDDNADAPSYALNLMRIPISVLSGGCTQTSYGAECTLTATPHLPDNLLPQTFRNLVVNDLVDLLGLQMTQLIESMKDQQGVDEAEKTWGFYDKNEREL